MEKITVNPQLITTGDGSHSLFLPELNEQYHSVNGALTEANHVYINIGLLYYSNLNNSKTVNVLEIGFGTGLNTLLTLIASEKYNLNINYVSIEAYPLDKDLIDQLNYNTIEKADDYFKMIHNALWGIETEIRPGFKLTKVLALLQDVSLSKSFDVIYFDAFAPTIQPELWEAPIFEKIFGWTNKNGLLTTYCAKGIVKRTLKEAGFKVENLPGPPGKREITRAIKL